MYGQPSLPDYVPFATILELPLDVLSVRLLQYLCAAEDSGGFPQIAMINQDAAQFGSNRERGLRALCEAWDWLRANGLLSSWMPGQNFGSGFAFVTRSGREVAANGLARLRAEQRMGVDLHDRIAARVRSQFLLGEVETAALMAMREVEIRVRGLSGASSSDIGAPLMATAFRDGGPLCDRNLDGGEREARLALFRGAIGVFKNPSSHRQVDFDDVTTGSEVVLFADLLLRILDEVEEGLRTRPEAFSSS